MLGEDGGGRLENTLNWYLASLQGRTEASI